MRKRVLFHFHTHRSVDSNLLPEDIVEFAVANKIEVLAPTDHDTIGGAHEVRKIAERHKIETIIGAEYATDHGDLIGLFLTDDAYSRKSTEVVEEIHHQGGLAIIPHPYRSHHLTDGFLESCDGIEVFNSRLPEQLNRLAGDLAGLLKKPQFYGVDAHVREELGLVVAEIEIKSGESLKTAFQRGMFPISLSQSTPEAIFRTKMIAAAKRGTPVRYCRSLFKFLNARIRKTKLA